MPLKLYLHLRLKNNIINDDYFSDNKGKCVNLFFFVVGIISFFLLNRKGIIYGKISSSRAKLARFKKCRSTLVDR